MAERTYRSWPEIFAGMLTERPSSKPRFEVHTEIIDVTPDPRFGGDGYRHKAPGLKFCTIDGEPVSLEEFKRRYNEWATANGEPTI